jgi:biopolymer transport protein TolR
MRQRPAYRHPDPAPTRAQINVTPLVDVCLVLLILFMVVTPMLSHDATVALPATDRPASLPKTPHQLNLALTAQGALLLDHLAVPPGRLAASLRTAHAAAPDRPLVLQADRRLPYRAVKAALQSARDAGFARAGLATDRRPSPPS